MEEYLIRQKYIDMVERYQSMSNKMTKIQSKYKFVSWFKTHHYLLTDAEREYLQESITYVEID